MKTENTEIFIGANTLRDSSVDELQRALKEARESLFHIREQAAIGATRMKPDYEKPHLIKGYHKLIARIETILREKQFKTNK